MTASSRAQRRLKATVQEQYIALQAATQEIIPPVPLNPDTKTMFDMIIASRDKTMWRPNDIFLAVKLAKTYNRIEQVEQIMDDEGILVYVDGSRNIHDLINFKMKLEHAALKLNRLLGLGALPVGVASAHAAAHSMLYSYLQNSAGKSMQDDLLAAPPKT